ncbi:MAG: hypothetical protein ACFFDI_14360 [Promethearchaeota archaeon]
MSNGGTPEEESVTPWVPGESHLGPKGPELIKAAIKRGGLRGEIVYPPEPVLVQFSTLVSSPFIEAKQEREITNVRGVLHAYRVVGGVPLAVVEPIGLPSSAISEVAQRVNAEGYPFLTLRVFVPKVSVIGDDGETLTPLADTEMFKELFPKIVIPPAPAEGSEGT